MIARKEVINVIADKVKTLIAIVFAVFLPIVIIYREVFELLGVMKIIVKRIGLWFISLPVKRRITLSLQILFLLLVLAELNYDGLFYFGDLSASQKMVRIFSAASYLDRSGSYNVDLSKDVSQLIPPGTKVEDAMKILKDSGFKITDITNSKHWEFPSAPKDSTAIHFGERPGNLFLRYSYSDKCQVVLFLRGDSVEYLEAHLVRW